MLVLHQKLQLFFFSVLFFVGWVVFVGRIVGSKSFLHSKHLSHEFIQRHFVFHFSRFVEHQDEQFVFIFICSGDG